MLEFRSNRCALLKLIAAAISVMFNLSSLSQTRNCSRIRIYGANILNRKLMNEFYAGTNPNLNLSAIITLSTSGHSVSWLLSKHFYQFVRQQPEDLFFKLSQGLVVQFYYFMHTRYVEVHQLEDISRIIEQNDMFSLLSPPILLLDRENLVLEVQENLDVCRKTYLPTNNQSNEILYAL